MTVLERRFTGVSANVGTWCVKINSKALVTITSRCVQICLEVVLFKMCYHQCNGLAYKDTPETVFIYKQCGIW